MTYTCTLPPPFTGPSRSPERALLVLSYNVKGLPGIAGGGANDERYRAIANTFRGYDVVGMQEVFWHRDYLREHLPHGYSAAYRSSRRGFFSPRVFGNGLAVVGHADRLDRAGTRHVKFSTCAGWIDGANDCPARKGLLRVPYVLANGDTVDIYTLHLDAANRADDRRVRATQLIEAQRTIQDVSRQRPVIVMGDFNIHRDNAEESQRLNEFSSALGLTDTRTLVRHECKERIDYIFYRDGGQTRFRLVETGIDARPMGSPALSDHPPIYAMLAY